MTVNPLFAGLAVTWILLALAAGMRKEATVLMVYIAAWMAGGCTFAALALR